MFYAFSECLYGQFGRNCSQFCEGCLLSKCDPVNGLCDNTSICSPGYIHSAYCNIGALYLVYFKISNRYISQTNDLSYQR